MHLTAPKTCRCGRKLGRPEYGVKGWKIDCACHLTYLWSFHPVAGGCWKITSDLPLFDTREIVG